MKLTQLYISILGLSVLAACAPQETIETTDATPSPISSADCSILKASDFTASISGQETPKLEIAGVITVASGGYSYDLKMGPLDRRQPPTQRLNLTVTKPDGMATQAITDLNVKASLPALSQSYQSVIILCGDEAIAEIKDVSR